MLADKMIIDYPECQLYSKMRQFQKMLEEKGGIKDETKKQG